MRIEARYKPWLLAGGDGDGRPFLAHALVERINDTDGRL